MRCRWQSGMCALFWRADFLWHYDSMAQCIEYNDPLESTEARRQKISTQPVWARIQHGSGGFVTRNLKIKVQVPREDFRRISLHYNRCQYVPVQCHCIRKTRGKLSELTLAAAIVQQFSAFKHSSNSSLEMKTNNNAGRIDAICRLYNSKAAQVRERESERERSRSSG